MILARLNAAISPESWLNQQMQYDLWQAEQALGNIEVKRFSVV